VSGVMLILSNLVSNLPAVLLFRPLVQALPKTHYIWLAVACTSTLAGNATPFSSVANLIVLQQAGKKVKITFWEFARVGLIVTLITTLAAIAILAIEHRLCRGLDGGGEGLQGRMRHPPLQIELWLRTDLLLGEG
jgi:Na+/H+ antiporter NhaD/arsenite permease-like protein